MSMVRSNKKQRHFTNARPKPRPVKGLEFTTKVVKADDGTDIVQLIDSLGAICGCYDTEINARKAMPFVKRNLERGFIPARWLRRARRNPTQHTH